MTSLEAGLSGVSEGALPEHGDAQQRLRHLRLHGKIFTVDDEKLYLFKVPDTQGTREEGEHAREALQGRSSACWS
jgi:hypothetical protein